MDLLMGARKRPRGHLGEPLEQQQPEERAKEEGQKSFCDKEDVDTPRQQGSNSILSLWGVTAASQVQEVGEPALSSSMDGRRDDTLKHMSLSHSLRPSVQSLTKATATFVRNELSSRQRILVLDTETSGFSSADRIVELAAVELFGTEPTGVFFHSLINGKASASIDRKNLPYQRGHPAARASHGITDKEEEDAPCADVVWRNFLTFCIGEASLNKLLSSSGQQQGDPTGSSAASLPIVVEWPIFVAHNAAFDMRMIQDNVERYLGIKLLIVNGVGSEVSTAATTTVVKSLCSMILFSELYPNTDKSLNGALRTFGLLGREDGSANKNRGFHGALIDARLTMTLWQELVGIVMDTVEEDKEHVTMLSS